MTDPVITATAPADASPMGGRRWLWFALATVVLWESGALSPVFRRSAASLKP